LKTAGFDILKMNREAKGAGKRRPRCEAGFLSSESFAMEQRILEMRI
jgi:hypothetical protein